MYILAKILMTMIENAQGCTFFVWHISLSPGQSYILQERGQESQLCFYCSYCNLLTEHVIVTFLFHITTDIYIYMYMFIYIYIYILLLTVYCYCLLVLSIGLSVAIVMLLWSILTLFMVLEKQHFV